MSLTLQSAPSKEPVTTSEMKTHLRQDLSAEDSLIDNLIKSARRRVESFTNRALIKQTWSFYLQDWPRVDWQEIPKPPLDTVTTVDYTTYDGSSDSTSTFSSSKYRVDTEKEPGRIVLKNDEQWPSPSNDLASVNPIEIKFDAGYGSNRSDVPQDIKSAIKMLVAHWYEHRKEVELNKIVREIPTGAKSLLWTYRVRVFG